MIKDYLYFKSPVILQNLIISLYGFSLRRKRYSGIYRDVLLDIHECRKKTKSEIRETQNILFLKIINHCFDNVPFYRNKFKKHGICLSDIKDICDIRKIPILDKIEVQKNVNDFIADNFRKNIYWTNNTSGSTGTPLKVFLDEYTYKLYMALLVDYEQTLGIRFGDRRATMAGRMIQSADNNRPPFWRYNKAENQMIFSSYHLTKDTIKQYVSGLDNFNPVEILGYPSSIYNFAALARNEQRSISISNLKAVITNSETLFEWQKETIENYFSVKVYDYYGSAENIIFATKCSNSKYHPYPLLGFVEVDNDKENAGDIIVTSFTNYAMPLIRYRIGDTIKISKKNCECGSNCQTIDTIIGRNDNNVITKDGKIIGRLDHIFKGLNGIYECQIIQESYENFLLKLVPSSQFKKEVELKLVYSLKERVGSNINVKIQLVKEINKTSRGKFKGVISLVNKGKGGL